MNTDARPRLDPDAATGKVLEALRRIMRAMDLHSHFLESRYGLTVPRLTVLKELEQHGRMSVGTLTRAVYLSQPTVTGILDRLEKQGLAVRHRSTEDKRRVEVELTDAGREMLATAPPMFQERFMAELGRLEEWERSLILSSLQRLASMMESRGTEEAPSPR